MKVIRLPQMMPFHRILAMPNNLWIAEIPRTVRISANENRRLALVMSLWITFRLVLLLLLLFSLWITPYPLALSPMLGNSGKS